MLRDVHRVNIEDLNTVPVRIFNHGVGNGTLNVCMVKTTRNGFLAETTSFAHLIAASAAG